MVLMKLMTRSNFCDARGVAKDSMRSCQMDPLSFRRANEARAYSTIAGLMSNPATLCPRALSVRSRRAVPQAGSRMRSLVVRGRKRRAMASTESASSPVPAWWSMSYQAGLSYQSVSPRWMISRLGGTR